MRDTRLYLDQPIDAGLMLTLDAGPTHYLKSVLRARAGQTLRVFNATAGEWQARLERLERHEAALCVEHQLRQAVPETGPTLLFAPIKRPRLEWLMEKAVELGVGRLQPVRSRHGVVEGGKPERLRQRIVEAVEQCERLSLPALLPECDLLDAVTAARAVIFADERGGRPLPQALDGTADVELLVGPEGGFSAEERAALLGFDHVVGVSLGPTILRAETAALMMLACHRARATETAA